MMSIKKIQTIDEKLQISYKTHSFEVWFYFLLIFLLIFFIYYKILDNAFDEYVVITDDKQIIKNLSRFRVSYKQSKREDYRKSSHSKSDSTKAQTLTKEWKKI
jgi:hypothetical protein